MATPLDGLEILDDGLRRTRPPLMPPAPRLGPEILSQAILPRQRIRNPPPRRRDRPPQPVFQVFRRNGLGNVPLGTPVHILFTSMPRIG